MEYMRGTMSELKARLEQSEQQVRELTDKLVATKKPAAKKPAAKKPAAKKPAAKKPAAK